MIGGKLAALSRPQRFSSVARSHLGRRRSINEDRVLAEPDTGLWAIADGMGGLHAGDLAASRVIEALAEDQRGASGYARLTSLLRRLEALNSLIFTESSDGLASGSTVVALLVHEGHYACLWAGDSRAYRLRRDVLTPISRDHSVVQGLVDAGELTEAERRDHPAAHIITRAVGAGAVLEIEQRFAPIDAQDVFLLCSDGLTSCVDDEELKGILSQNDLVTAADELLALALARDAPDNVSLILIRAEMADRDIL